MKLKRKKVIILRILEVVGRKKVDLLERKKKHVHNWITKGKNEKNHLPNKRNKQPKKSQRCSIRFWKLMECDIKQRKRQHFHPIIQSSCRSLCSHWQLLGLAHWKQAQGNRRRGTPRAFTWAGGGRHRRRHRQGGSRPARGFDASVGRPSAGTGDCWLWAANGTRSRSRPNKKKAWHLWQMGRAQWRITW